jgi:hypothetical protein
MKKIFLLKKMVSKFIYHKVTTDNNRPKVMTIVMVLMSCELIKVTQSVKFNTICFHWLKFLRYKTFLHHCSLNESADLKFNLDARVNNVFWLAEISNISEQIWFHENTICFHWLKFLRYKTFFKSKPDSFKGRLADKDYYSTCFQYH